MKSGKLVAIILVLLLLITGVSVTVGDKYANYDGHVLEVAAEQEQTEQRINEVQQSTSSLQEYYKGTGLISVSAINGEVAADAIENAASAKPALSSEEMPQEPELRFMAVGDIMLGRGVGFKLQKAGSYEKAFEKVSSVLIQGDIVFANLETPLTASTHGLDSKRKIVLRAKPETVTALTSAGFNMISLSNNHIMDYYEKGLFDTMSLLKENNILHAGGGKNIEEARKPAIIEKNGLKIGLLAYTDMAELVFAGKPFLSFAATADKSGVVPRKYETIREDVMNLRDKVDLLAVSLHWGVEDSFAVTAEQVEFAHDLIDDGVDIILGHHPHQFQGIELYKGKPILYSMGNFLFDQNEPENMESFIIDMNFKGAKLVELTAIPVRIIEKSYVDIQTGEQAVNILVRQAELCRKLGMVPVTVNDRLVLKQEE